MIITELDIAGCYVVTLPFFSDVRGSFIKTFNIDLFKGTFLENYNLQEEFYSVSKKNVLRGLHFQIPPHDHSKIVCCVAGKVKDFFLDIRKSSKTFGKYLVVSLNSNNPQLLFLPKGIAHGFISESEDSILIYKTDSVYNPECDEGILWSSIGLDIDDKEVIISERDRSFPSFENFDSPFL